MGAARGAPARGPLRRLFVTVAIAAWMVACPRSLHASRPETDFAEGWFQAKSAHFTVFSNAGRGQAVEIARGLEKLADVLAATNPGLRSTSLLPTFVFAFEGSGTIKRYSLKKMENPAGYFGPRPDCNLLVFDFGEGGWERTEVLNHEFIHCYFHDNLRSIPTWLNEGLAQYYSTFRPGSDVAEIGRAPSWQYSWFRNHHPIPIQQLFASSEESGTYKDSDESFTFYAESWALVHFLQQGSEVRAKRFAEFIEQVRLGHEPRKAFADQFPEEHWPELLDLTTRYFGNSQVNYVRYRFDRRFENAAVETEPMPPAEVFYRLGDVLSDLEDRQAEAEEHLRTAIELDSMQVGAIALLGVLYDRRGNVSVAESLYIRAVELAPGDVRPFILSGRGAESRNRQGTRDTEAGTPPALLVARRRYQRALEIDPDNLDALAGFGRSYTYDRRPAREGVTALRLACRALPARIDLTNCLMVALARSGNLSEADSIFRVARLGRSSPDELDYAAQTIFYAYLDRADSLARAGRTVEAESLLVDLTRNVEDSHYRSVAEERVAALRRGSTAAAESGGVEHADPAGQPASGTARAVAPGTDSARPTRTWRGLPKQLLGNGNAIVADEDLAVYKQSAGALEGGADILHGIALTEADRLSDARAVFKRVADSSDPTSTLRGFAVNLYQHIQARIAIDRAVVLARSGQIERARDGLEEVLNQPIGDHLREHVRNLIQQADRALATPR